MFCLHESSILTFGLLSPCSLVFNYFLLYCLKHDHHEDLKPHMTEGKLLTLFCQCMTIGEQKLHTAGRTPKLAQHLQDAFDELQWEPGDPVSERAQFSRPAAFVV